MSRSFKDALGREWALQLDPASLLYLQAAGVDLVRLLEDSFGDRMKRDYLALCDVLYLLCKEQATRRGVSEEDFGRGLAGDVIDQATEALFLAFTDRLPSRERKQIVAQLRGGQALEARLIDQLLRQTI